MAEAQSYLPRSNVTIAPLKLGIMSFVSWFCFVQLQGQIEVVFRCTNHFLLPASNF